MNIEKSFSPVAASQRILLLDVFRGLAIFGILMVNMPLFNNPISLMLMGSQSEGDALMVISESFIKFFFEGKFYVLFSMLFGYGFWLFINKSNPDGRNIIPVYLRRVLILLMFGILHVVLLWAGDILVFYALFGFLLILFRKVSDRGLIKWTIWLSIIPSLLALLMFGLVTLASQIPEAKEGMEAGMQKSMADFQSLVDKAYIVYSQGKFSEMINVRLLEYKVLLPGIIFFYPMVLAMFLFGSWIARKGYIKNYREHLPLFRKAFWWSLPVGIILNGLYAVAYQHAQQSVPGFWTFLATFTHAAGGVSFALVYTSAIVLLTANGKLTAFNHHLSMVGRMALTNYLLQSIICTTLFLSYGFGLFGKIEIWQGIILTLLIFAIQIPLSKWWLSRFKYGPFEWFWRSLTYMKMQSLGKGEK